MTIRPLERPGGPVAAHGRRGPQLTIGREITLSSEITSCDKLIIEGSVEANNCRDVEIADSGLFKGTTSIEEAEIQGRFEGNLVVRKRVLIKASGRVSGTIRYGQIELECSGQISGDIQAQPSSEHGELLARHAERARRELTRNLALPLARRGAPEDQRSRPRALGPHHRFKQSLWRLEPDNPGEAPKIGGIERQ